MHAPCQACCAARTAAALRTSSHECSEAPLSCDGLPPQAAACSAMLTPRSRVARAQASPPPRRLSAESCVLMLHTRPMRSASGLRYALLCVRHSSQRPCECCRTARACLKFCFVRLLLFARQHDDAHLERGIRRQQHSPVTLIRRHRRHDAKQLSAREQHDRSCFARTVHCRSLRTTVRCNVSER